jgi:hypothetical protein
MYRQSWIIRLKLLKAIGKNYEKRKRIKLIFLRKLINKLILLVLLETSNWLRILYHRLPVTNDGRELYII